MILQRLLTTIVITLSLAFTTVVFGKNLSLRDQKFKDKHLKKLGQRKGHLGHKAWENFIKIAPKYEDAEILKKMLSIPHDKGTQYATYLSDLFETYKLNQNFFIKTAYSFYNKKLFCVVEIFKTTPELVPQEEIRKSFDMKSASSLTKKFYEAFNEEAPVINQDYFKKQLECAKLKKAANLSLSK